MRQGCVLCIFLVLVFVGCGDDSSDKVTIESDESDVIKSGLNGDTYFNPKFGVKITELPTDTWTIRALGSGGLGFCSSTEGFIPLYWLLLMEPVPTDKFIGLDENADLNKIIKANMPVICIMLDYLEGDSFKTYDLTRNLNDYALLHSRDIESKKSIYIGNSLGLQAVLVCLDGLKEGITWFAKGEVVVRCELWSTQPNFDKYFPAYEKVVNNIWLMGK